MRLFFSSFTFLLALFVHGDLQEADAAKLLRQARSLRCEFPSGGLVKLGDSTLRRHEGPGAESVFDDIDRAKGTARLIGNIRAVDVKVIAQDSALSFLEIASSAMVNVTVVFARFRPGTRDFLAADSEHDLMSFGRGPEAIAEQYYGTCKAIG
jgi:hypothetical protein